MQCLRVATLSVGRQTDAGSHPEPRWGHWWLPETDARTPGEIVVASTNRVTLNVVGGMRAPEGRPSVIHGLLSDGTEVTLPSAHLVRQSGSTYSRRHGLVRQPRETWESDGFFTGALLPDPEQTLFSSMRFGTPLLGYWSDEWEVTDEFSFDEDDRPATVVVQLNVPPPRDAVVPGIGKLRLEPFPTLGASEGHGYYRLASEPVWIVRLDRPRTSHDIYTNVALPLLLWTTFCVGAGDNLESIALERSQPDGAARERVRWFPYGWAGTQGVTRPHMWSQQLLPFGQVQERFASILSAWFDLYGRAGNPIFESCLELLRGPSPFLDGDFLVSMRSAESFHERVFGGQRLEPKRWRDLRKRLLDATEGSTEERAIVESLVVRGNKPSLRTRITALVDMTTPIVRQAAERPGVIRNAVNIRNKLAHGQELGVEEYPDLWAGKVVVEFVMRAIILRQLGFTETEVEETLSTSRDWPWLEQLL